MSLKPNEGEPEESKKEREKIKKWKETSIEMKIEHERSKREKCEGNLEIWKEVYRVPRIKMFPAWIVLNKPAASILTFVMTVFIAILSSLRKASGT